MIKKIQQFGIDGVDLDFENTKIYEDMSNPLRDKYLSFYQELVQQLKEKGGNDFIISVTPQAPYVVKGQVFPNAYEFHNDWFSGEIMKDVDFMNVQYTCSDPTWRLNNLISPLYKKYGKNFGGIMVWNTTGDVNGEFTTDFVNLFNSTPAPTAFKKISN